MPGHENFILGQYADMPPSAIMVPMVNSDEEARNIIYGLRFPPIGKRSYGGCFDPALTPPSTPAAIVYESVKKNIEIFSRGGGYIFAGEHNIPGDTPEEHLMAILDAYNDCIMLK